MKSVFADSLYWIAIARPNDPWHQAARDARASLGKVLLVTTDEVLVEFLTALSKGGANLRKMAVAMTREILNSPDVVVLPQSRDTFLAGLKRFERREDKQYSLTDCVSMNAMDARQTRDVLSNDHHFEQEGFHVLIPLRAG